MDQFILDLIDSDKYGQYLLGIRRDLKKNWQNTRIYPLYNIKVQFQSGELNMKERIDENFINTFYYRLPI